MAKKQHKERIQQPKESQTARDFNEIIFPHQFCLSSAYSCLTICLSTGF